MTLSYLPFVGPNIYSDGPTSGLSIHQLWPSSVWGDFAIVGVGKKEMTHAFYIILFSENDTIYLW